MKTFILKQNIGKAKYVVKFHDGVKQHPDGSPFSDIAIFTNKKKLNAFTKALSSSGYQEG